MLIKRAIDPYLNEALSKGKSVLLLGPRQTGKSTFLGTLSADLSLSFLLPKIRQKYEMNPSALVGEIAALPSRKQAKPPLVILDEVQKVPQIMDVVQHLIDNKKARFILTGSSARKLKRGQVNLLPGRVLSFRMDPLTHAEYPHARIEDHLRYGALPQIMLTPEKSQKDAELDSYVTSYLEEEIRSEAIVRNVGTFGRFLELAAAESGLIVNFKKLSQTIGVSHSTIMDYYQILEDCLITERVEPWTQSATRKKLIRSQRYLFFDLGVRRFAAKEGVRPALSIWGHWFEQWVGLELIRSTRRFLPRTTLHFWKDTSGAEVDWVLRHSEKLIPVEVKWSESVTLQDARHLITFLKEYPQATEAFIICRAPRAMRLADHVTALPWQDVSRIYEA